MQQRPVAITILAILLWLAGAVNVVGTLQEFGYLPALGGSGALLLDNQVDGWLLAGAAILSLFLAGGLWANHDLAKRAVVVVAVLNIVVTLFTRLEGADSWLNIVPGVVINVAILLYARTADARDVLHA